jgi:hypothetical protein
MGSIPLGFAKEIQGDRARVALSLFLFPIIFPTFFLFLLGGESAVLPQKIFLRAGEIAG